MAERTSEAGHRRVPKGRAFEDEVAHLYRLLGYTVEQNIQICQKKVDILARYQPPASHLEHRVIIECKDEKENVAQNQRVLQFIGLLRLARQSDVADAAEIITRRPWGDQAKGASSSAGIGLYTFEEKLSQLIDFRGYLRRVVHDFEHYDELVAPDGRILKAPVIDVMTASDLFRTYVPLVCRVLDEPQPGHLETLEPYVERWLDDPDHNHLSILGDFGTGKSSFCLRLTYTLAKRCREDPVTSRIPLFISLRDYATAVNIRQLITDLLLNKYGVPIANYSVFNRFLESRRLILIFDGFDEMATKTDRALTIRNFDELTKAAVPGSKTVLTCRSHYFTGTDHMDEILRGGRGSELLQRVRERPSFQLVELQEFTDDQIKDLLKRRQPKTWTTAWIQIRRNLYDLARRPLLLDMIIKTADTIEAKQTMNTARLYDAYTNLWIERDDYHARMTPSGKKAFMEDLGIKLWEANARSIHFSDLREHLQDYFKAKIVTGEDLDYLDHDARTNCFLNRDEQGNYRFIHKSFMEFFVAKRVFWLLRQNQITPVCRHTEFSPEISSFLAQLVAGDVYALEHLCHWAFDETGHVSWNAIYVLAYLKSLKPEPAATQLVELSGKRGLRSGVAWVLGELGVPSDEVVHLLEKQLSEAAKPSAWWEAAFALEKLQALDDPVGALVATLPPEWTYAKGLEHIRRVSRTQAEQDAHLDQRAIVAVVRAHREADTQLRRTVEEEVEEAFSSVDLSCDTLGRRSYYAVWLFGELRIQSAMPTLLSARDHPRASVRNMLAEAIGKIGEAGAGGAVSCMDDALRVLTQLVSDGYYRTRLHAAEAIGKIRATSLLPDLEDALEREPLRDLQMVMRRAIELLRT